jgi:hypothetical protein
MSSLNYITQIKNKDLIDVRQYGAKGDGSNDDTAEIQAAITDNPGKVIFFPCGDYRISSPLTITSDRTSLIGAFRDAVFLTQITANTDFIRIGDNVTKITGNSVKGITLVMLDSVAVGTTNYGINLRYTGLNVLEDIRIYGNDKLWRGINVSDVIGVEILNSRVENTISNGIVSGGTGTTPRGTVDVRIEGSVIMLTGSDGIKLNRYSDAHYIRHNQIYGQQAAYCLNIAPGFTGNFNYFIRGNDFSTNESDASTDAGGIFVGNFVVADISDNTVNGATSTSRPGIMIEAGGEARIEGHAHVGIGQTGIENNGDLLVSGSTFNGSTTAALGIDVKSSATMSSISGCQFLQYPNAPIALHASADKTIISGNVFRSITDGGTFTGSPTDMVLGPNYGLENVIPSVASATSIAAGNTATIQITGVTTVTTITGGWDGRELDILYLDAGITIGGGGNIPYTTVLATGDKLRLIFASGNWY